MLLELRLCELLLELFFVLLEELVLFEPLEDLLEQFLELLELLDLVPLELLVFLEFLFSAICYPTFRLIVCSPLSTLLKKIIVICGLCSRGIYAKILHMKKLVRG